MYYNCPCSQPFINSLPEYVPINKRTGDLRASEGRFKRAGDKLTINLRGSKGPLKVEVISQSFPHARGQHFSGIFSDINNPQLMTFTAPGDEVYYVRLSCEKEAACSGAVWMK